MSNSEHHTMFLDNGMLFSETRKVWNVYNLGDYVLNIWAGKIYLTIYALVFSTSPANILGQKLIQLHLALRWLPLVSHSSLGSIDR